MNLALIFGLVILVVFIGATIYSVLYEKKLLKVKEKRRDEYMSKCTEEQQNLINDYIKYVGNIKD